MTTPKHTPGPWTVDVGDLEVVDRDGYRIAQVNDRALGVSREEVMANAALLAAAPDLLAACEEALDEDSGMMCAAQLRAAIAQAKGGGV